MAGAMRKMGVYLGLVEDQEHDDDDERYDAYEPAEEHEVAEPERRRSEPLEEERVVRAPERRMQPAPARLERSGSSVATLAERRPTPVAPPPAEPARITALHPRTYNEARTIGEHFRDGTPVIMNLSEMEDGDAKRLVDFAAGLVFAVRGTIERITSKVFLLSPADVIVTAEDKARIAENGFFNQS